MSAGSGDTQNVYACMLCWACAESYAWHAWLGILYRVMHVCMDVLLGMCRREDMKVTSICKQTMDFPFV